MKPPTPPPRWLPVTATIGLVALALPLVGLLQRMPWSNLIELLGTATVRDALRVSLTVSMAATVASVVLGLPIAILLARHEFRGIRFVRTLVLLPMVLPPVVGGTALLFALGRRGLVGGWLDRWFGVQLAFSSVGAVVAATFVAMPFFVLSVETALRQAGTDVEEVAATLGAGPTTTLWRVTLPRLRGALAAGAALSWARALGEFGATITFAGNLPGRTQTLPVATFVALESDPEAALALSLLLLVVAFGVLFAMRGRLGTR